jgi:thiol-disulfide isomerase/thioredoxin
MKIRRLLFLAAVLAVTAAAAGAQAKKTVLGEGDAAPKFTNPDLAGRYLMSTKVYGGWVLIDFFATWCEPCKKELPELEKLYVKFGKTGKLQAVLFDTDTDPSLVGPFFQSRPTPLTVVLDRYQVTAERFGVESLPMLFLVDPSGKIAVKGTGETEALAALARMETILSKELGGAQ